MMRAERLEDIIRRGLGKAAGVAGQECDAFRPSSSASPLVSTNRFLRLRAAFVQPGATRALAYGEAAWEGIFDAAYTRPGDYLVRAWDGAVWFVAAQEKLAPVMCVRAERVVTFARPGAATAAGVNSYGGVTASAAVTLLQDWPASVLTNGGAGMALAKLPGDVRPGSWRVLLPAVPGVVLRGGDLMTDDLGQNGVVSAAELSALGWRLTVRQTTT
jgi:hypothetical protein